MARRPEVVQELQDMLPDRILWGFRVEGLGFRAPGVGFLITIRLSCTAKLSQRVTLRGPPWWVNAFLRKAIDPTLKNLTEILANTK